MKWETDPARRAAALALALPLQFDEDIYRAIAPAEQYTWIRQLAFVTDKAGRCRYHDVVRAPMLRLQRLQSPARWRAAHDLLTQTFRTWRTEREESLPNSERCDDAAWREHHYNETYHRLCADPRRALPDALTDTVHACEEGNATARRWTQLFAQAGADIEDDALQAWGERLTGASRDDTAAVLAILDALLAHPGMDTAGQLHARVVRGRLYRRAKRNEAALADLTAALVLDPRNADALVERAFIHEQMGNTAAALADMDEAIRVRPDAWTHVVRGYVNMAAGHRTAALTDFDHALALEPEQEWARVSRAEVYRIEGRYDDALTDLDRALAIDPHYTWAHAERSRCLRGLERWDEALHEMAQAADLDSETHWHRAYFALLLLDLGRHAEALREMDRALAAPYERGPRDRAWPHAVRAWALHGLGRESEALATLDHAVSVDDEDPLSYAMRGWLLWEGGRLAEAERDFDRALSDDPSWPWPFGGRGTVRLYTGQYEEAIADFTRAFTIQCGITDAENEIVRPLVELLRQHLPANRAAITAAIRRQTGGHPSGVPTFRPGRCSPATAAPSIPGAGKRS
ncbi:tetratricopeptide repeat protein [Streptomyces griseorubiginosus]|uniref:tetratricopeptide repeat protein n=1 Tax=Streptomyces griseorubiginosus TaxID=67304 RepID=UPI0033A416A0